MSWSEWRRAIGKQDVSWRLCAIACGFSSSRDLEIVCRAFNPLQSHSISNSRGQPHGHEALIFVGLRGSWQVLFASAPRRPGFSPWSIIPGTSYTISSAESFLIFFFPFRLRSGYDMSRW